MKKIIAILSLTFLAASCQQTPPKLPVNQNNQSGTSIQPASNDIILTLKNTGGLCVYGGCRDEYIFYSDGRVQENGYEPTGPGGEHVYGERMKPPLTPSELQNLKQAISAADFEAVKQSKFGGLCPTAFDGTQSIFTIHQGSKTYMLDSCENIVDPQNQPFKLIFELAYKEN